MQSFVPVLTALTAAMLPIQPVDGLAAESVQVAIEELAARPTGGGGGETPVALAVAVDPIEGVEASNVQEALVALAGRPTGGAELPNASTVPVRPARIEFTVPDGIAPPTFGFYLQLGQITYPNGSSGFETYKQVFERVASHGAADENGNVVAISVDGLKVSIALAGELRMTGPAAEQFGIPDEVFLPKPEVEADTDADHVRVGDETLTEALDRVGKLPNASTIPAQPSAVTFDTAPLAWPQPWDSVQFIVGNEFHPDVSPTGAESWTEFLQRVGGLGLTDENGENPLTVDVNGTVVTITSGARLQSNSGVFFVTLGSPLDVSPSKPIRVDTNSGAVRHGGERLSTVIDRLAARPAAPDPRSVIRGLRSHDAFPMLIDNGASPGDQLNFNYQPASGPGRQSSLPITSTTTVADVVQWLRESPDLNPSGHGTEIDADLDALRAFIVWSKSGYQISLYSTAGDQSGVRALLGSLPN